MTTDFSRRSLLQAAGATAVVGITTTAQAEAGPVTGPAGQLVTYPIPSGIAQNASFEVKARLPRSRWQSLSAYLVTLKIINEQTGSGQVRASSMVHFDFSGPVEVQARYTKGAIESARIRPLSYGIEPIVDGDTLRFTLPEPRKVVVEVNGEIFDCLHILANAIETDRPAPDDPDVLYFGPGVHTTADGTLTVPSGKTVYLAGGALLKAHVVFDGVENAGVRGRGFVYGASGGAFLVHDSRHISIDGVASLNNPTGYAATIAESRQVAITNFTYFSSGQWGDGIDVFCSSDVLVDNAFLRCADDCIALYTHRWDYYGDTRNITVRNSTLWADVAHPFNVGTHGNTDNPEVLENLTLSNVDILDHREPQKLYQGCIALNPGDSNLVRNVRIQDVRVEDFRWGQLVHMRVAYNKTYNTSPGRGIETVYIRNLSYNGSNAETAIMLGYDESRGIKDVTYQNLAVNGTVIADTMQKPRWYLTSDKVPMHVNEHVTNLRFLDAGTAPTADLPVITAAESADLTVGAPAVVTISATGFPDAFAADGLPDGLTVDRATGVISGVPGTAGTFTVGLGVTNVVGTARKDLTLTVH